jgi:hypothetical protein
MSTWHQDQARKPLWHPTKWSVVDDPPNDLRTITLCDTQAQAEGWQRKHGGYILRPGGSCGRPL